MNIITGYRGTPHITSAQDRDKNQGAFGVDSYILNVGEKFASEIISASEIRIRDGVLSMQGCVANIEQGAYETCEISNGTQGMQRRDLIVARYTKNAETNIEDIQLVVIEGTPSSSTPSDPAYNDGDIQAGDSPVDFPLYRVNISGVTVSSVTRLAPFLRTQAETDALLGDTSISGIGGGTVTGAISTMNGQLTPLLPKTVNNLGSAIDLNSYAAGTLYTFPRDGYVVVTASASSAAILRIYSAENNLYIYWTVSATSTPVFVLKGMRLDIRQKTGTIDVKFQPLG